MYRLYVCMCVCVIVKFSSKYKDAYIARWTKILRDKKS